MSAHEVKKFYRPKKESKASHASDHKRNPSQTGNDLTITRNTSVEKGERPKESSSLNLIPKKKKSCRTPDLLWRMFPRQQLAFEFSHSCFQNSAVFAFESEEFGREGQRKYLVTTYYNFGQRYLYLLDNSIGIEYCNKISLAQNTGIIECFNDVSEKGPLGSGHQF